MICAGGTALAPGFIELFRQEWKEGGAADQGLGDPQRGGPDAGP